MLGDVELLGRIENGESDCVEFTASTTDLDKFRKAICAFANDLPGNGELGLLFLAEAGPRRHRCTSKSRP